MPVNVNLCAVLLCVYDVLHYCDTFTPCEVDDVFFMGCKYIQTSFISQIPIERWLRIGDAPIHIQLTTHWRITAIALVVFDVSIILEIFLEQTQAFRVTPYVTFSSQTIFLFKPIAFTTNSSDWLKYRNCRRNKWNIKTTTNNRIDLTVLTFAVIWKRVFENWG